MTNRRPGIWLWILILSVCLGPLIATAQQPASAPDKIYVPYEDLQKVFETEQQGVFLPYQEFQRLWRIAMGTPAGVQELPSPYLISTARITGRIDGEVGRMQLELTIDILADGWLEIPIGLTNVAVAQVSFDQQNAAGPKPLLRVVNGQYTLVAKGQGRRTLKVDFLRQLTSEPGLKILSHGTPPAAITTFELLIPQENLKVDVEPMLAATTTQVTIDGKKATKLQAFLGSAEKVKLSWKPQTQAAADLDPVVIAAQLQHIHVGEALINYDVNFDFDIRRRGVDSFAINLPADFRVISVDGPNISKWDLLTEAASGGRAATAKPAMQILEVKLFSPAKDSYSLKIKMERFLQEEKLQIELFPVIARNILRRTGTIALTHSPRRSVELIEPVNLARVDTGRLPTDLRERPGVIAHYFITPDYGAKLNIATVDPRITVEQLWALGVDTDRLDLRGKLKYKIERTGIFQLSMSLPEPLEITSLGPPNIVDDYQITGQGAERKLTILLNRELEGDLTLDLSARAHRAEPDAPVNFVVPLADADNLHLYSGQLLVHLAEQFRAEVAESDQLQPLPVSKANRWTNFSGLSPAMAFEFRTLDRTSPAGADLKIDLKPTQISAVVHRLVNIQPGSIEQEAVLQYRIRYAPVDTLYLKIPASLTKDEVDIAGADIKEKPRIDQLPPDQMPDSPVMPEAETAQPAPEWAYYKIVLQAPKIGTYTLRVRFTKPFQAGQVGSASTVPVEPVLAAGKISNQTGHIAIAKDDTLAIGEPTVENLTPAEASSAVDLPYESHRRIAFLAFKYTVLPFKLSLPVVTQTEAAVFTTIVRGAVVEQVLANDGTLNAHATYALATSRGDRLPITLPRDAKLFGVILNGTEVPVELGTTADTRIVRLPPSAGQITKYVLEISYGLKKISRGQLLAPQLPDDIPVQQTLWRIWVPEKKYLLAYDRDFVPLDDGQASRMLGDLGQGYPAKVQFKLAPQGEDWDFVRQGSAATLSVTLAHKEIFTIVLWIAILAAGAVMLKLDAFTRCLLVLALAVVAAVLHLFTPLLISRICSNGVLAAVIVAVLWFAYWITVKQRRKLQTAPAPPRPASGDRSSADRTDSPEEA